MDEFQKKSNQKHDTRSRKVRFKISSAYSGRVLKQMYEDGQELEIPAEDYSHNGQSWNFEPRNNLLGIRENPDHSFYPSAKLNAQRISVFREGNKYTLTSNSSLLNDDKADGHMHPRILDFGRIIIYTSNLKIIRTPLSKKELMQRIMQSEGVDDCSFMNSEGRGGSSSIQSNGNINSDETESGHNQHVWVCVNRYEGKLFNQAFVFQEDNEENSCSQCKGSGSAPCAVCHGSKFSMLANRFKESYRALRCPACNENGQQPCQICV
ncbi:glutaredoxin domain-containing cysteine-rich protein 2 [Ahaetulla prasina]|uniref:glutaredoxin domain-containing cysteine-rich protein 2 n=1 Tax=Ahaetulla prasina TaxID=499056 RepID=UPI002647C2C7|nr:glutaredoxin domain-containing cysteine-rich protein 2 [Ahaetulla prasina]